VIEVVGEPLVQRGSVHRQREVFIRLAQVHAQQIGQRPAHQPGRDKCHPIDRRDEQKTFPGDKNLYPNGCRTRRAAPVIAGNSLTDLNVTSIFAADRHSSHHRHQLRAAIRKHRITGNDGTLFNRPLLPQHYEHLVLLCCFAAQEDKDKLPNTGRTANSFER